MTELNVSSGKLLINSNYIDNGIVEGYKLYRYIKYGSKS